MIKADHNITSTQSAKTAQESLESISYRGEDQAQEVGSPKELTLLCKPAATIFLCGLCK